MKSPSFLLLITLTALFVLGTQTVFAGQPVDPSTLNPPPPPEFNPVCEKNGNQTICTVQFSDPPFAGGSGIICGSGPNRYEVFQFENRSVLGHRYYDTNGNLVRRHFHEVDTGTFSNPIIHAAVSYSVRLATRHELSIPGDITSGTQYLTGNGRVYSRDGETIEVEAGRTINAGDGTFIRESGPHPFQDFEPVEIRELQVEKNEGGEWKLFPQRKTPFSSEIIDG